MTGTPLAGPATRARAEWRSSARPRRPPRTGRTTSISAAAGRGSSAFLHRGGRAGRRRSSSGALDLVAVVEQHDVGRPLTGFFVGHLAVGDDDDLVVLLDQT